MTEISLGKTTLSLAVMRGRLRNQNGDDADEALLLQMADPVIHEAKPLSPASMGVDSLHDICNGRRMWGQFYLMDVATGVTTSLLDARLVHDGELPQPEEDSGRLKMHHRARVCDFLHVHGAASSGRGNGDRGTVPDRHPVSAFMSGRHNHEGRCSSGVKNCRVDR